MAAVERDNVIFVSFIEGTEEERHDKIRRYFRGNVPKWASDRARRIGDIIIPKHACITLSGNINDGEPTPAHRTFYIEHSGMIPMTEEKYHRHHMVCDCVLKRNLNDGQGGVNLEACFDLHLAANLRARRFGKDILSAPDSLDELETDPYRILVGGDQIALAAIETALSADAVMPEIWPGTVVSGEMPVEQVGELTGQPLENVVWLAEVLQSQGKVAFDGQKLRLAA